MTLKKLFISIALLGQCFFSIGQNSDYGDYNWIHGSIIQLPDGGPLYDNSFRLNFSNELIKANPIKKTLTMSGCNASYSDENGKLLIYSNGSHIGDSTMQIMENGDSLLEMSINDYFKSYYESGYPFTRTAMFLPMANDFFKFVMILRDTLETNGFVTGFTTKYLVSSDIFFDISHPMGRVLNKRKTECKDRFAGGQLTACKHANGRDWWINLIREKSEVYLTFLLDTDGFHEPSIQQFPIPLQTSFSGGSAYSPDGTKFCHVDAQFGVQVFDFDRCTGELSNFRYIHIPYEAPIGDLVISPNSRFMYVMTGYHVIQFDLNTSDLASLEASADTVGYTDPEYPYTNFAVGALAPDGKIYITTSSSVENNNYFSIIHYPDRKGKPCQLQLIGLKPPFQNASGSMPNFPNYRLGPLDGSVCDTLGIDNIPKARFRINHDTLTELSKEFTDLSFREPTSWYWTFGDGESSTAINPIHIYSKKGDYEVCLTVSNQYGSDTACKTFGVWPVRVNEPFALTNGIDVFPNPASYKFNLSIKAINPLVFPATFYLYDMLGRQVLSSKIQYGTEDIDISSIQAGLYIWNLSSNGEVWGQGKVVVER